MACRSSSPSYGPLQPTVSLKQRLDRGLEDLTKLEAHLVDLDLPATRTQVREITRLFKLLHPERHAEALSELRTLLELQSQGL